MKVIRSSNLVKGKMDINKYKCVCPHCLSELQFDKGDVLIYEQPTIDSNLNRKNQAYIINGGIYDGYYLLVRYEGNRYHINCIACENPITFLEFGDKVIEQIIINPKKYTVIHDEINDRFRVVKIGDLEEYSFADHEDHIDEDYDNLIFSSKSAHINFLGRKTYLYDEDIEEFVPKMYKNFDIYNHLSEFCLRFDKSNNYFDNYAKVFVQPDWFGEINIDNNNNIKSVIY